MDGELPPTWGYYEVTAKGLRQAMPAPKLDSVPATRDFMAALLRRASDIDADELNSMVSKQVEDFRKNDQARIDREIENRSTHYKRLSERVAEIERISGVKIDHWGGSEELGRAIKAVVATGAHGTYGGIRTMRAHAAKMLKDCDDALKIFPAEEDQPCTTAFPTN